MGYQIKTFQKGKSKIMLRMTNLAKTITTWTKSV